MSVPFGPEPDAATASALEGKRVVVIEDEGLMAVMLKRVLQQQGALVVATSPSVEEGLAVSAQEKPDLVLVDLPVGEDAEAVEAVHQLSEAEPGCIVVMATAISEQKEQQLRAAGASAVIGKPFTAGDLLPLLEETYRTQCPSAS